MTLPLLGDGPSNHVESAHNISKEEKCKICR